MRAVACGLALALAACGLDGALAVETECTAAQERLQDCGATLPFLTDGPCTGLRVALAECVTEQSAGCDQLASLAGRPDVCAPELAELTGLGPPAHGGSESVFYRPVDAGTQLFGGDR